jgi:predicted Abi (CAAX) family protease
VLPTPPPLDPGCFLALRRRHRRALRRLHRPPELRQLFLQRPDLLVAPLFEELVFRGFILALLQESDVRFWAANAIAGLMFLGLHIPGWYFMGSPKTSEAPALLGIILVGLMAGLAKRRSGSLWGAIVFHFANNVYASFVR